MTLHLNLHRFSIPHPLRLFPRKFAPICPLLPKLRFHVQSFCCVGKIMAAAPIAVKEKIDLTEKEEKIFNRLMDVLKHFELDTELRVAGGWVRDKLLGKDCYDIDIALDNMLGRDFCEKVNKYLQYAGEEQQGVCVIQCSSSAEQSNISGDKSLSTKCSQTPGPVREEEILMDTVRIPLSWHESITGVGQTFENVNSLRMAISNFAIAKNFVYKYVKNDLQRVTVECEKKESMNCKWRLHASPLKQGLIWSIKTYNEVHACGGGIASAGNPHANRKWVASLLQSVLKHRPTYRPVDARKDIHEQYGIKMPYNTIWNGRELARQQLYGEGKRSYDMLRWYEEKVNETNPGSFITIHKGDDGRFVRMFICYRPCYDGFIDGCRPLLFLDGTFIKDRSKGILLAATAYDADNGLFPLAFCICNSEDTSNWCWFLSHLSQVLYQGPRTYEPLHDLVFVSDSDKGLKEAVRTYFPQAFHSFCVLHLAQNYRDNLKKKGFSTTDTLALGQMMKTAAYRCSFRDFERDMVALKGKSAMAYNILMTSYPPEKWANSLFIGVSNPDQSKHLETARMRIYDTWIDFVNLRSETYVENSRIPTMKFGTTQEDAYRRDLTINSLFYNINTSSVEDFTGRGVQDLKNGYIATPLPPKSTFLDDPLRVLRAIRFGARFAFVLDEELKKAASDEEVKAALADKISRERIGHEVDLMISGNHPARAMAYISDLQLFFVVFALPENPQPDVIEGCDRLCVSFMDAAWNLLQLTGSSRFSDEQHKLYLYGSLFLPLRNTAYLDRKSKQIPVASYIFRNSLKLKASYAEMVVSLHAASERFILLIPFLESNRDSEIVHSELEDEHLDIPLTSKRRVLAGLLLWKIKDFWRVALLMSTLLYPTADLASNSNGHFDLARRKEIFLRVESTISELELDNVWELKPLLDGKAIMDVLQLKAGPNVRKWQERLVKWQLAHPQGTREECLDWMRQPQVKRMKLDCT